MKKSILFLICLLSLFCQAEAKKGITLSLGLGHTWAINREMEAATGGKSSLVNLSIDYEFASLGTNQYLTFLAGLKFGLPRFDGERITYASDPYGLQTITSDWHWITLTPYVKVLINKNDKPLVPYAKAGVGWNHLSIKYDPATYLGDISKSCFGYIVGFGLEYSIGHFALMVELEDNIIPNTNLKLLDHQVKDSNFLNPQIGFSYMF
jgi:opacity protein-like surface antigen